mmetsp:Transcript_28885/g.48571  ORF Transcript_28885/g.48571 Transcript_28885/m.48571 type:complete len:257 (+) Transcript_28885:385-1155(+)
MMAPSSKNSFGGVVVSIAPSPLSSFSSSSSSSVATFSPNCSFRSSSGTVTSSSSSKNSSSSNMVTSSSSKKSIGMVTSSSNTVDSSYGFSDDCDSQSDECMERPMKRSTRGQYPVLSGISFASDYAPVQSAIHVSAPLRADMYSCATPSSSSDCSTTITIIVRATTNLNDQPVLFPFKTSLGLVDLYLEVSKWQPQLLQIFNQVIVEYVSVDGLHQTLMRNEDLQKCIYDAQERGMTQMEIKLSTVPLTLPPKGIM